MSDTFRDTLRTIVDALQTAVLVIGYLVVVVTDRDFWTRPKNH